MVMRAIQDVFCQPFVIDPRVIRLGEREGVGKVESGVAWQAPYEPYVAPEIDIRLVVREEENAKRPDSCHGSQRKSCMSGHASLVVHGASIADLRGA